MPDPRWMWAEAVELLERAERLQRQFFQRAASRGGPAWEPPVDIFDAGPDLMVMVALPGVPEVEVTVECGVLRVAGVRNLPAELRNATIQRLEIPHGRFERRLELPPGVYELAEQELAQGCLTIKLRKLTR